jgi:hypothetical protein
VFQDIVSCMRHHCTVAELVPAQGLCHAFAIPSPVAPQRTVASVPRFRLRLVGSPRRRRFSPQRHLDGCEVVLGRRNALALAKSDFYQGFSRWFVCEPRDLFSQVCSN